MLELLICFKVILFCFGDGLLCLFESVFGCVSGGLFRGLTFFGGSC